MNSESSGKWIRKLKFRHLTKIPIFVLIISAMEMTVYYASDDKFKRVLLFNAENKKEIWRFLTYMLLHTNALHLGLNVLIQGLFGTPLEFEQGRLRCAVIYFGGGLGGSLGAFAFATLSSMAGASSGVYALLTSQIPNIVLNYETIKYVAYRIVAVTVLAASDVIYVCCHVHFYNNEKPRIEWAAHAFGAATGLLFGFLLFNGTSKWKKIFRLISCVLLVFLCLLVIIPFLMPSILTFLM